MHISIDKYCSCGFGDEFYNIEDEKKFCVICSKEVMPPNVKKRFNPEEIFNLQKSKNQGAILIVDDQDFFRKIVTDILSNKGYIVKQASNGLEAIKHISLFLNTENLYTPNKTAVPRIVILDLNMPGLLNGIQTLGVLRTIKEDIKVIILTSTAPKKNLLSTLGKLGAKKYINKKAQDLDTLLLNNIASISD